MISALFYLQFNSIRNRLLARLRRLKRPKYLVSAIIGGLYFVFYFSFLFIHTGAGSRESAAAAFGLVEGDLASVGAALLLLLVLLMWALGWIFSNERRSLVFSEAEIAFLFPAPISRRGLIHYKLVRSQLGILFSTLLLTLIRGRWLGGGGHALIFMLGSWLLFSTLSLNLLVESFTRTFLFERGLLTWRRRTLVLGGLVLFLGGVVAWSWQSWPALPPDNASLPDVLACFHGIFSTGALAYVLYPFRLVVQPLFAPDALSFFKALGPALVILAAHYCLVVRMNVAFEEASIEYSQKLATRIATFRNRRVAGALSAPKKKRDPFPLAPTGLPSLAFLWKNLILAGNYFTMRFYLGALWMLIVGGVIMRTIHTNSLLPDLAGGLCVGLLMISLFMGPNVLRVDFRADLNQADLLKQYPLPGWQIVLGEILAPVTILATLQWLLILASAILMTLPHKPVATGHNQFGDAVATIPPGEAIPLGLRMGLALAAAFLAPAIDLVMLIIPNAVALLMPSWVRFDKNAPRGFENFGQNIILVIGQMLVLFVALLPAGLVFWLTFVLASLVFGLSVAAPLAALAATAILLAEGGSAIYLLGAAFESFDLSAELTA
jgi:hypothetical protein